MKLGQLICTLGLIALIVARPVAQSDDDRSIWTIRDGRFVGGSVDDRADAIAVDAAGNSYIVGITDSPDFPLSAFVPLASPSFRFRGFIVRTDAVTGTLSFRYVDGTPTAVAVGVDGNPVIAAGTTDGAVILTKFVGPTLDLIYSTNVMSGSCCETIALAIDPDGNAVTAGVTYDYTVGNGVAGFVIKLDARGRQIYSRRIPDGVADALAVDGSGSVFVSGMTYSMAFATTAGAFQRTEQGRYPCVEYDAPFPCPNAFVVKLNDAGGLVYSTLLGGEGLSISSHTHLAVNRKGEALVTGGGPSTSFPIASRSLLLNCAAPCAGQFVAQLSQDGSALQSIVFLRAVTVNAVAVDPLDRLVVVGETSANALPTRAAVQPRHAGGPVFRTSDEGSTWSPTSEGLAAVDVEAIAVSRRPPVVAFAATSEGVFQTTDRGQTWSPTGLTDSHVSRIVVDPQTPSIAYAASYTTVFKTMDGGRNWTAVSRDLSRWDPASLTIAASAPSTLYLGAENGVFKTTDAGSTWSRGAPSISSVRALAVDPRDAASLYALANNRFALSRDGGATWSTPTSVDAGGGSVNRLLTDPTMPTTVLAYGNGVYRSSDAGATWRNVLPSYTASALAIDPVTPSTLYATSDSALFKSVDGGVSWARQAPSLRQLRDIVGDPSQRGALFGNVHEANRTGFVAVLDLDAFAIRMATYFGGTVDDRVTAVAVDRGGQIHVAGITRSPSMPFDGARPPALNGTTDAYVAVLSRSPQRGPQPRDPK